MKNRTYHNTSNTYPKFSSDRELTNYISGLIMSHFVTMQVQAVKSMYDLGYSYSQIAKILGLNSKQLVAHRLSKYGEQNQI